ncbi:MAG: two-component sensor histidine kinase, partial [Myxococcales bacterium]|nr:two-component sensor histidine kinase [Myxococcales bacterium]
FLNIIVNAAHAIESNHEGELGRISIRTSVRDERVVVEISDDGGGIPEEIRERIFDPFFTTKQVGRGTGQGLAIARKVVERHGGELRCVSSVGVGTTFTIELPIEARHE